MLTPRLGLCIGHLSGGLDQMPDKKWLKGGSVQADGLSAWSIAIGKAPQQKLPLPLVSGA